jgi:hypothetical protein
MRWLTKASLMPQSGNLGCNYPFFMCEIATFPNMMRTAVYGSAQNRSFCCMEPCDQAGQFCSIFAFL